MNLPEFKNPPSLLKATYFINTPMFAAGGNTQEAELTPTTFKGVLRFWWRALNWSKIRLISQDDTEALKELHRQESKLFGVAANNDRKGQGQGACLINSLTLSTTKSWPYEGRQFGLNYLMGQGLFHFKDGLTREAIRHNQEFNIELTVDIQYHQAIIDVLKLIGLLGGFGSRSRHGLGSVTLTDVAVKAQEQEYHSLNIDISDIVSSLSEILDKYKCKDNSNLPPITAFYAGTRIDVLNSYKKDTIELLNELGEEEQLYRSYGRNGQVNGNKVAEKNFRDDHDLILSLADNTYHGRPTHPRRAVFGLPHNYFYSSNSLKADVDSTTGRRSSPLFFHVHKKGEGHYQVILCLMKSKFLPEGEKIQFSTKRKSIDIEPNIDWSVITDFMDRQNKETL
ncbi:type III-B CRISPR module RAMP protein Cmr1 [Psychrobacter lutiphocae]|uniref:type III-B CRISPR module RAMP protein Cmr1 n=1 Tax=Psychrobacter lutiphocae TaxID=540500 RepID=UPI00036AF0A8|nr:type III-B CRISPR module RAMP protein Cmr1 [Psychrobacter lutiphocae]